VSAIRVIEVADGRDRKVWTDFIFKHYREHPLHVPPMRSDERRYFDPGKNPAFDVSDVRMFLAYRDDTVVGRVLGLVHEGEARKLGYRVLRFGWFETVDDPEVTAALLDPLRAWGRAEGCREMVGPLGFTDLDPSGILVEGHEQMPTMAGSYQYPYYPRLLEGYGLRKRIDYLEFRMDASRPVPLLERLRGRVDDPRYRVERPASRKALLARSDQFWQLVEATYEDLYGVVPLTEAQTRFYTERYLSYLDPDFVVLGLDESDRLVGMFVGMPSMSRALRRARGRLFPTGILHLLRAYRRPDTVDLLLAAVHPDAPTDRLTTRGLIEMYDTLRRRGVRYLEANRQLETNTAVHRIWRKFDVIGTRRVRVYHMPLEGRRD